MKGILLKSGLFLLLTFIVFSMQAQKRPMGVNLDVITDWSPQFMFVNAMRQCREWLVQPTDGRYWDDPSISVPMRPDGYPTHVPFVHNGDSMIVHTLLLRDLHLGNRGGYPAGEYTLIFEGTGEIQLQFDASGSYTQSDSAYTVTINDPGGGIGLRIIRSDSLDPVRNIRFIMPGFRDTYESDPFHPKFLELLKDFQVLRFLWPQWVNESFLENWADRTPKDYYTQGDNMSGGGLAYEWVIELSNRLQADPWVSLPHLVTDDFVTQFAALFRDSLDTDLKLYLEYGNELWNGAPPFYYGAQYTRDNGMAMGLANNEFQAGLWWGALRSFEIFDIMNTVYGGDSTNQARIIRILSAQSANPWTGGEVVAAWKDTITANPRNIDIDMLSMAPYFGGGVGDAIGDAGLVESITVEGVLDSTEATLVDVKSWIDDYKLLADTNGLTLGTYEGGQHLNGFYHQNNATLIEKLLAANRHPRMKELYRQYYDLWYDEANDPLSEERLFVHFDFVQIYSSYGSFGLLEHMHQDTATAYKWQAMYDYVFTYPRVRSITGTSPNPIASTTVDYQVLFSEIVSGIDAGDFELVTTGTLTAQIDSISSPSGQMITVHIHNIAGDGTLALNLRDDDSIIDSDGFELGNEGAGNGDFEGEVYRRNVPGTVPRGLSLKTSEVIPSVLENEASGTLIGTFLTDDLDIGDSHDYSFANGIGDDWNSSFVISGDTLFTNVEFDYDLNRGSSYTIRVRTTDSDNLTFEENFTIKVLNVNEPPVSIELEADSVMENLPDSTFVGEFNLTDTEWDDQNTASLVPGEGDEGNSLFYIENNNLYTDTTFNYEEAASHSIRVRSTDQGGLSIDSVFTIIIIDDTGESLPEMTINSTSLSFDDTPVGATDTATFEISNTGDVDLVIHSITYPSGFSGDWVTGGTILAGGSQDIQVFFSPVAAQSYTGNIEIDSNDEDIQLPVVAAGMVVTGVQEAFETGIAVFPNPIGSLGELNIQSDNGAVKSVRVFDSFGNIVKTLKYEGFGENKVSFEGLPKGVYTVAIEGEYASVNKKVIK